VKPKSSPPESVEDLKAALGIAQRQISHLLGHMSALEARLEHQQKVLDEILGSRIWRTLVAGGNFLLRLRNGNDTSRPTPNKSDSGPSREDYKAWIATREENYDSAWVQARTFAFRRRPRFSVIVGSETGDQELLCRTVQSLESQSYPDWDLAFVGKEEATGDLAVIVDPGDQLAPHALFALAEAFDADEHIDLVYTDEDVLDPVRGRIDPFFKPDWSPELLLSQNYVGGLLACKLDLWREAASHRTGSRISNDHALTLALCDRAEQITHLPQVLYHRHPSTALPAVSQTNQAPPSMRIHSVASENLPVVSILMPTCNLRLLRPAIESLQQATDYPHYEIVVIDNSRGRAIQTYAARRNVGYCDHRGRHFNFSFLINQAAQTTSAPWLLLLNDDTRVIESGWLRALVNMGQRPGVGAVGGRLLFPDRRLQHAGVIVGLFGTCDHAFRGLDADQYLYRGLASTTREVSAVTGACLLTPRALFKECGGLDEITFPVAFQDIDYCLRLRVKGYRILYTPSATLIHQQSVSMLDRGIRGSTKELQAFRERWADFIDEDPYYNRNLTREATDYSLRRDRHLRRSCRSGSCTAYTDFRGTS
jgi:O-antigen biosynthesis protein